MTKFWGLTVNVGRKFKQQVQEPFCISGAALEPLDIASGKYDEKPVLLYLQQDQNDYLLCSLSPKQSVLQVGLNVRIGSGETVGFHLKGGTPKSKVHLTGFTLSADGDLANSSSTSPGSVVPFKGQQKSILVTEPKSVDKQKKRVSIVETEPYGEREELDSDEEGVSAAKKLFNGTLDLDEEDDSEDSDDMDDDSNEEEDSDSELNDEEKKELLQFALKGKYDPKTGGKLGEDEDEDSDLDMLEEEDDDEEDDDDEDDTDDENDVDLEEISQKKQKQNQQSPNSQSPKKQAKQQDGGSAQSTPTKPNTNNVNKTSNQKTPENKNLNLNVKTPSSAGNTPLKSFSKGGVLVNEIKAGNGGVAKPGKMVTVYYEGRLKSNNKKFDASQNGPGFKFRLGKGEVIRGWDLGIEGMKVGGKRRLVVPAQLAYGKRGAPPEIPPNATLVFEVELKNVS